MKTSKPKKKTSRSIEWRRLRGRIAQAQKDLVIDDATRRELMFMAVGKRSCSDMDCWDMRRVLEYFKSKGWRPKSRKQRATENNKEYQRIHKYWLDRFSLPRPGFASPEQLTHIQIRWTYVSRSENEVTRIRALRKWLHRMFGVAGLEMLSSSQAYKAIEALKKMDARQNGLVH